MDKSAIKIPIPNNLRMYRKLLGYRLRDVAEIIGVDSSTVCKWEKGVLMPGFISFGKLTHLYRADPVQLYGEYMELLKAEMGL